MAKATLAKSDSPRIENGKAMQIAGLTVRYTHETRANIPAQWDRFAPHIGRIPGQLNGVAYGVCWNFDSEGRFDYLTGVEVSDLSGLPDDFSHIAISAQRYAVFTHSEHVSALPNTIMRVWSEWLPKSGHEPVHAPCFERYGERFDPRSGMGEIEIWVPVQG